MANYVLTTTFHAEVFVEVVQNPKGVTHVSLYCHCYFAAKTFVLLPLASFPQLRA